MRIRQEIYQNLQEQLRVALAGRQVARGDLDQSPFPLSAQAPERLPRQSRDVHHLLGEWFAAQSRERKQCVDQISHLDGIAPGYLKIVLRLRRKMRCEFLDQDS